MLRRLLILILLLLIVAGGAAAWWYFNQPPPPNFARVERGDVAAVVEASGQVTARQQARLAFKYGGRLIRIVDAGEQVQRGQVLAEVEPGRFTYDVQQARGNLTLAELRLAEARYRVETVAPQQLAIAKANVERAGIARQNAQREYDRVAWNPDLANAAGQVLQLATLDYQTAQANYQLAVVSAEADRKALASWEKQVELAKLSVSAAEAELAEARLLAPFDGTVLLRQYRPGELAPGGVDCIVLADTSVLEVRANVDEIDIAALTVGQPVRVILDAYPTQPLTGTVREIAPLAQALGGSTALEVRINFAPGDVPARVGMSASLRVQVAQRTDVLLVPNRAIQTAGSSKVVDVLRDGRIQRVAVVVGLSDGVRTEIRQGVSEGEPVVVP